MQRWSGYALSLLIFVVCTTSVMAAPEEKGGTPNPMGIWAETAVWAIVVFGGLFAILYFKAWPLVLEGLQKREETIRSSLEEAKRTRIEMEQLRLAFQKDIAEAHQQIPRLMEEARRDAEAMSQEMRAKAAAEIQAERERLRREVEIAKDQAIKEIWEQSAQLATLISAKAIGRSLNEDDHRRLLDEGLREMSAAANN
jgi:F-type H+-transporting ATPase subunit b